MKKCIRKATYRLQYLPIQKNAIIYKLHFGMKKSSWAL